MVENAPSRSFELRSIERDGQETVRLGSIGELHGLVGLNDPRATTSLPTPFQQPPCCPFRDRAGLIGLPWTRRAARILQSIRWLSEKWPGVSVADREQLLRRRHKSPCITLGTVR
ncbi:hypothetical protein VUR80DRAFT_6964 [Thermomyces stellatus]